jgi:5'-AMP-activated protein kinase catalytic alpha subunit
MGQTETIKNGCFLGMVIINQGRKKEQKGMRLGKYELGKTLGEGNFGKVKLAKNTDSEQFFAVKILEKNKIVDLNNTDQVCVSFSVFFLQFHFIFLIFFFFSILNQIGNFSNLETFHFV